MPDLIVWNEKSRRIKFSEVKSTNDRLSEIQKAWLAYLSRNQIECEVCLVNWPSPNIENEEPVLQIEVFDLENFEKE